MDRHPIFQSLAADHLARVGLVVWALHQVILVLIGHTISPLNRTVLLLCAPRRAHPRLPHTHHSPASKTDSLSTDIS